MGLAMLTWMVATPSWANPPKLSSLIGQVAQQEGLDPNLLKAVVAVESKFDTVSVSTRGAVGLMQLMPDTARMLGVSDRFDPEENLRGGARYLRQMIERFPGSISLALAAYNAGPANVSRFGGMPPFPETKRYVQNVLSYFAKTVPGRNHSPKNRVNAKQTRTIPSVANVQPRRSIVRLLGEAREEDEEETPVAALHSPSPTPAPKAVHTVRGYARTAVSALQSAANVKPKPTHSSRLIPYVSSRHITGKRYQAKNIQSSSESEEIPIVVLRR